MAYTISPITVNADGTTQTITFTYSQAPGTTNKVAQLLGFYKDAGCTQQYTAGQALVPGIVFPGGFDGNFYDYIPSTTTISGAVSGVCTLPGTYTFYIRGDWQDDNEDSGFNVVQAVTITVNSGSSGPLPSITPAASSSFTKTVNTQTNIPYSCANNAGLAVTWTISGSTPLPPGMGLTTSPSAVTSNALTLQTGGGTVYIAGTPSASGVFTFTIQAVTYGGISTSNTNNTLTVTGTSGSGGLTLTSVASGFSGVTEGQYGFQNGGLGALSVRFVASGGTGTVTYNIVGSLPRGVTFNTSTGVLDFSNPTDYYATYGPFTVGAQDQTSPTPKTGTYTQFSITLTKGIVPILTVPSNMIQGTALGGSAFSINAQDRAGHAAGDDNAKYYWSVDTLPGGLVLNGGNPSTTSPIVYITGTPTVSGSFTSNVTVQTKAIDAGSPSFTLTFPVTFNISSTSSGGMNIVTDYVDSSAILPILQYGGGAQRTVFSTTGGTGNITWSYAADSSSGYSVLPTGSIFNPTYVNHVSASLESTIIPGPTSYGHYRIIVTATDSSSPTPKTKSITYDYTVTPQALMIGSFPAGDTTDVYDTTLSGYGGDALTNPHGVIWNVTWTKNGISDPNTAMTVTPNFTNNTCNFHAANPIGGNWVANVTLTVPSSQGTKTTSFAFNFAISGSGVIITAFTGRICTVSGATVFLGAYLSGGVSSTPGHNTFTISGGTGTFSPAGPYLSGQSNIRYTPIVSVGTEEFLALTSVEDVGASTTTRVTQMVSPPGVSSSSISPPTTSVLIGSAGITLTNSIPNSCDFWDSTSDPPWPKQGNWTISPATGSGTLYTIQSIGGRQVQYVPPTTMPGNPQVVVTFTPLENVAATSTCVITLQSSTCALTITPSSLPAGTQGSDYNSGGFHFAATNNVGSVTWVVATGSALPTGLILDPSGLLHGTPTASGTFNFSVSATDGGVAGGACIKTQAFSLVINSSGGGHLTSMSPHSGNVGQAVSFVGTGLLSTDTLVAIGTVSTVAGPGGGTGKVVTLGSISIPGGGLSASATMPGGFQAGEQVDIALVDVGGNYISTLSGPTNAFTYSGSLPNVVSVNPASVNAGSGSTLITVNGNGFDATPTILWDGGTVPGANPTNVATAGTQLTVLVDSSGLSTAGSHAITVRNSDGATGTGQTFTVAAQTPIIDTTQSGLNAIACTRGASYTFTFSGHGGTGALTWSVPAGTFTAQGLTLVGSTGVLSGTVSSNAPSVTFTLTLKDSLNVSTQTSFTLSPVGGVLTIDSCANTSARNGDAYSSGPTISGGATPYHYAITSGALPHVDAVNRMTMDATTGLITGTPNDTVTTYNYHVQVTDSSGSPQTADKDCYINLSAAISKPTIGGIAPNTGPLAGNTAVVITGTNFAPGAFVKFGSSSATNVVIASSTQISCLTPAGSVGAVNVIVTNTDGGAYTLSNGYTYAVITAPVITSIDKPDGPFAGGRTVNLIGTDFQGTTQVQFGGNTATIIAVDTSDPTANTITVTTPASTSTDQTVFLNVDVSAQNPEGTGTLANGYTYRPPPIITAIIPNQGPTTGGQTFYILGKNFFSRGANNPQVIIGGVVVDPANVTLKES